MSSRPEILFPLFAELETLAGVGPKSVQNLAAIEIFEKPRDLIFTLPQSGVDRRKRETVQGADLPGVVTVEVDGGQSPGALAPGRGLPSRGDRCGDDLPDRVFPCAR